MTPDVLTFSCPHCGVRLTIPSSMAGVIGPCPQCRATIEAPRPAPSAAPMEFAAPQPSHAAPARTPAPAAPAQLPPEQPARTSAPAADISRSSPPAESHRPRTVPPVAPSRPKPAFSPVRLIFPLLFLLVGVALVFGLLHYYGNNDQTTPKPPEPAQTTYVNPGSTGSTVRKILDDGHPEPATPDPTVNKPIPAPDDVPKQAPVDPLLPPDTKGPTPPEGASAQDPSGEEFHIIGRFLDAKSLEERIPLMETKLSKEELAKTILAGPLPERLSIEPGVRLSNTIESFTDCYYTVTLAGKSPKGDAYTVLVRRRSDQPPRVLAEPVLDLIGGRLAAFAATPNDDMKIFQVFVFPSPFCENGKVPDAGKKITMRLDGSEIGNTIATAYISKASKISETLSDPTAGLLRYGSPKPCTIVMEWNRREDPEKPYLEVVDIKAFTWNP